MTIDEIKELIHVVHETGIAELEVQRGEDRVRIRRAVGNTNQEIVLPAILPVSNMAIPVPPVPQPPAPNIGAQLPPAESAATEPDSEKDFVIKSPIVGTYYDAPSPGAAPFVKIGDRVEPRQVLCIIESMKLMNEIEAEITGTVVAKLVENSRPVEYGEALFTIRP